jgi:nucleoside-diphosphate-sugar epimerase
LVIPERTLVIGGGGFVGSAILSRLGKSHYIVGTTRAKSAEAANLDLIEFDLFDQSNWNEVLERSQPKTVICTAWETEHKEYWNKETNKAYSKAIQDFATLSFTKSVEKFVGLGSMSEYGYSPGACFSGVTPLNPQDLYSETKIETSIRLKELASNFGKKFLWLRLFQPYGPLENSARLLPSSINSLIDGESISIKFPNHALDFLNVYDVANAIKFLMESDAQNEIDIGSGYPVRVEQVLRIIGNIMEVDSMLIMNEEKGLNQDRLIYVDPASEIFKRGWVPLTSLEEGLEKYIDWLVHKKP